MSLLCYKNIILFTFQKWKMEELFGFKWDQGRREISKKTNCATFLRKGSNVVAKPRGGNHAELRKGEYRSYMRWRRRANAGSEYRWIAKNKRSPFSAENGNEFEPARSHLRSKGPPWDDRGNTFRLQHFVALHFFILIGKIAFTHRLLKYSKILKKLHNCIKLNF